MVVITVVPVTQLLWSELRECVLFQLLPTTCASRTHPGGCFRYLLLDPAPQPSPESN